MTDGSPTRWSAAAMLAPTAAAVFTGVTAWTLHHPPAWKATSTSNTAAAPATTAPRPAAPRVDPSVAALRGAVHHDSAKLAQLQKTLAKLRNPATAKPQAAGTPAAADAGSAGSAVTAAGAAGAPVAAPAGGGTSVAAAQPAAAAPVKAYTPPAAPPAAKPVASAPAPAPAPPPPVTAPAPAPAPPPTNTKTGASGVPK